AGSAAAVALARRGRLVIALDRATFPSDTVSTHLFFPPHWAELELLGARDRVLALDPPLHTQAGVGVPGVELLGSYRPVDGFAVGSCVRRPGLDKALVDTARAAGAEVRERARVTELLRDGSGRVVGVRWEQVEGGGGGEISARLVVGADGRRSAVARLVGTTEHHSCENGRMMAFAYYDDPRDEVRHIAMQWRSGDDLATVFPCDGGKVLVLLMPPRRRVADYRGDRAATFEATIASIPALAARLEGCARETKIRVSSKHPSYFRHSHGRGWALTGDAGHFKDPVTAQGIRDALRFGRLLGEAAAPVLEDADALDRALASWERDRDEQCLPMYQWSNTLGLDDSVSPLEAAAYRWFAAQPDGASELLDVFSRRRKPTDVFSPGRAARWMVDVARDPAVSNQDLWATVRRDASRERARLVEQLTFIRRREASAREFAARPAIVPCRTAAVQSAQQSAQQPSPPGVGAVSGAA
ncbi:MAG: NAD(P)/FAD-dependent oxidoreductase, partial [Solirubrobacteraceae bacterium]